MGIAVFSACGFEHVSSLVLVSCVVVSLCLCTVATTAHTSVRIATTVMASGNSRVNIFVGTSSLALTTETLTSKIVETTTKMAKMIPLNLNRHSLSTYGTVTRGTRVRAKDERKLRSV
jgi:uncharacterized membrane protein